MYKLCKTEQSASRQRQLEIGLLEIMSEMRFEDISVSDLCARMDIPRKSFYRYFSSKDGALHALIDHTLMEYESFNRSYMTSQPRSLVGDLEQFFLFWIQQKPLLDALSKSDLSGVLMQRAIDYAISDVVFPGRFLPGETRQAQEHVVMFAICGLLSMTLKWHLEGYKENVHDMAKVASRLLTQPLFPAAGKLLQL